MQSYNLCFVFISINVLFFCFFFFFFFQAEDGIRDKLVTGVQTCALPIYSERLERLRVTHDRAASMPTLQAIGDVVTNRPFDPLDGVAVSRHRWLPARRSEERRVGKECRWRGSLYPLYKTT